MLSVGTRSPSARVLRRHASWRWLRFLSTHTDHNLRPWRSFPLSSHTHGLSSLLLLHSLCSTLPHQLSARPAPFLGVASSLRQSGADTPPSLVTVTGDFLHPPAVFFPSAPNHQKTLLLRVWSFGGKLSPMMNHGSVCAGVLAGNLAASPSIPWGMSPHGARWLWVPFDGVGSCGGGGVVASLMDDVWWKRGV